MDDGDFKKSTRKLAAIEDDLIKAEEAFSDADARFKKAEDDRRTALETINKHQMEMDNFIEEMRQFSVPGTKWRPMPDEATDDLDEADDNDDQPLELHSEDIIPEKNAARPDEGRELTNSATKKSIAKNFDRLKESANSQEDDPVLKVVASPNG